MSNMRDFFGALVPLPGEQGSNRCAVVFCRKAIAETRATDTTVMCFCQRHAQMYDSGSLRGSLVMGYEEEGGNHAT